MNLTYEDNLRLNTVVVTLVHSDTKVPHKKAIKANVATAQYTFMSMRVANIPNVHIYIWFTL